MVETRRRRTIAAKKPNEPDRYVIALRVEGRGNSQVAEMWSNTRHPIGLPEVGDQVDLPIDVRAYVQGGLARYSLTFGGAEKGETF